MHPASGETLGAVSLLTMSQLLSSVASFGAVPAQVDPALL